MIHGRSRCYKGVGIFPGVAIGKAYPLKREPQSIIRHFVTNPDKEIERVELALSRAISQLEAVKDKIKESDFSQHSTIIDAHLMIISDPSLKEEIVNCIKRRMINAEWAVEMVIDEYKKVFDNVEDSHFSEKASDLEHIKQELLKALTSEEIERDIDKLKEGLIVVAYDLSPADTLHLNLKKLRGFAIEGGGRASHTAILARSLEIPAVIQASGVTEDVDIGDAIIIDGIKGVVIVDPEDRTLSYYREEKKKLSIIERKLLSNVKEPARTKDGHFIRLYANLELLEEVPSAIRHGSEGVGLFRTEYLYIRSSQMPTVDEQFKVYKHLGEEFGEKPVVIRTLDLGGEKYIPYLNLKKELNPALGLRAIRLCLKMKNIFSDQIEAILRASPYGNLKILIPLVTRYEDVEESLEFIGRVKDKLRAMGVEFNDNIEIGAMIEVPSSVYIIDKLSELIDFFSVGTNDLIQYTLAVDRGNDAVTHYFDPLHPSVLRLLCEIVEQCESCGKPVSICGEIGGNPLIVPLLIGIGYNRLSMNPLYIPVVKEVIKRQDRESARDFLDLILSSKKMSDAWKMLKDYFDETTKDIADLLEPFIPYIPHTG